MEEHPTALPDLLPGMQLSAIRKLPVLSGHHYTEIHNHPGSGAKQALSVTL